MKKVDPKDKDFEGKVVGLKQELFDLGPSPEHYLFRCDSGFGCKPFLAGKAIFGQIINGPHAGARTRVDRGDVEFVAEENQP